MVMNVPEKETSQLRGMATMGGSWEGGTGEGRKETEKRKEGRRRGGEKEGENGNRRRMDHQHTGKGQGLYMNVEL